jgi:hypothetical protein
VAFVLAVGPGSVTEKAVRTRYSEKGRKSLPFLPYLL